MINSSSRKIIVLGKQPMISLPRGWVRFWNLKKAQSLSILYDSVLIVIPSSHPNKDYVEKIIKNIFLEAKNNCN